MTQARPFIAPILALAVALGLAGAARGADDVSIVTQKLLVDPLSGIALYGYDPVAYFIEQKASAGRPAHEWRWAGVTWRFASEANRAAFMRSPEAFVPAYGGYDGEGVQRKSPVGANPAIFALKDDRLFMFRSNEARDAFFANGGSASADKFWPAVQAELAP